MTFCHLVTCRCWQTNNSLLRSLTAEAKHCGLGFVAPSTGDVILEQTKHPGRRGVDVRTIEASVSQSVLDSGPLGTILRVTSFYFILLHSISFYFILFHSAPWTFARIHHFYFIRFIWFILRCGQKSVLLDSRISKLVTPDIRISRKIGINTIHLSKVLLLSR